MAGVVGFVGINSDSHWMQSRIEMMLRRLYYTADHKPWSKVINSVALGQMRKKVMHGQSKVNYYMENGVCLLVDGEILNKSSGVKKGTSINQEKDVWENVSDYQWLLALYEQHGQDFVRYLSGSFNIIVWDSHREKLIIANDRFGSRPLYYSQLEKFYFASELKALIAVPIDKKQINEEAIIEFFTLRHMLTSKTPVEGVNVLPPANCLVYQHGRINLSTYWIPPFDKRDRTLSLAYYRNNTIALLKSSLNRIMQQQQKVGFLLSGGLDSRLLVGLVNRKHFPLHTFTRGTTGCMDARLAERVAGKLGTEHHFKAIEPDFLIRNARQGVWLTDGMMTSVDFYALSNIDQIKQYVDKICFGIPAGPIEGLGLSRTFYQAGDEELAKKLYESRGLFLLDWMQAKVLSKGFFEKTRGVVLDNLKQIISGMPFDQSHHKSEYYFLHHYGPRSAIHGPVLARSEVETSFPFIDTDLLDFIYTIPFELRLGRKFEIEVLKHACPDLVKIPWQFSGLPVTMSSHFNVRFMRALYRIRKEISWRSNGFIPEPSGREQTDWPAWFRTDLKKWLEEMLLGERTSDRGYYNPKGIRSLIDDHMSGRYDRTLQFGVLLTFEIWNRLFVDGEAL